MATWSCGARSPATMSMSTRPSTSQSGELPRALPAGQCSALYRTSRFAAGMVAGAMIGSQVGEPSETDSEPQLLVDQLRTAVPRSGSAIVLIAAARDVDEMLIAIGDSGGEVIRQTLTADQAAALQAALSATPAASLGPSKRASRRSRHPSPGRPKRAGGQSNPWPSLQWPTPGRTSASATAAERRRHARAGASRRGQVPCGDLWRHVERRWASRRASRAHGGRWSGVRPGRR